MGLQPTLWQRCCGEKGQEANFGKKVSRPSDQPDLRYKGQSGWKLPGSPMVKTWPSGSNPGQESRIPPTSRTEQQKKKKKKKEEESRKGPLICQWVLWDRCQCHSFKWEAQLSPDLRSKEIKFWHWLRGTCKDYFFPADIFEGSYKSNKG